MNTIQELWESFRDQVIPKNAPPAQIREIKNAFYGGAIAMTVIDKRISEPDISEDAGVAILEGVYEELRIFATTSETQGKIL